MQMVDQDSTSPDDILITFAECNVPYERFENGTVECSGVGELGVDDPEDNTSRLRFALQ